MNELVDSFGQPIKLRRRRGFRGFRVAVARDGQVTVTTSRFVPILFIRRFVAQQQQWITEAQSRLREQGYTPPCSRTRARARFLSHRESARVLVQRLIVNLNQQEEWKYAQIAIRDQRTRWGSCSARGVLSFNYRIVFLPEHLAEYIVAHELCHLREHNHGVRFWALLEQVIADAQARHVALRSLSILDINAYKQDV